MSIRWHPNDRISMSCFLERIKADEVPKQPLASPLIAWPDLADLKKYMNIDVVSHWFSKQTIKRVSRHSTMFYFSSRVEARKIPNSQPVQLLVASKIGQPVGSPLFFTRRYCYSSSSLRTVTESSNSMSPKGQNTMFLIKRFLIALIYSFATRSDGWRVFSKQLHRSIPGQLAKSNESTWHKFHNQFVRSTW